MEPDNPINPITNSTLVPPTRENEKDNIVSWNVPPSVTEIELSFNSKDPPPHAEDEGNRLLNLNHPARLIIKLNVFNNPLKNNTPSNDPPSITEIDPPSNEPPSIIESEPDDSSNSTDLPSIAEDDERNDEVQPIIDNQLLNAAIYGNCSELKHLVLQDPEIMLGTTPQGSTCLHISSLFGHVTFFKAVLALNQSLLSSINSYGETPLIVAVTSGHVSLAFAMLKEYKELNFSEMILKQDDNGENALHHAIRNGHSDLALELIVAEPGLSQGVNKYNESPMYIAVLRDFCDVLERLLKIPLSSVVGTDGENALHAAVTNGNPDIAKKIVEARPWLAREEEKGGNTPMQIAVLWNRLDVTRVFLEHDCSSGYLVSSTGAPLLVSAALRANVGVAQEILKYCPDAPYSMPNGWTMLHQAVISDHEHFVEFILETPQLHKLINMPDKDGDTALHIAVLKCKPNIVRALLAHKATNPTVRNNYGQTAEDRLDNITEKAKTLNWVR